MTEEEWLACASPELMSLALGRKASKRKRRLFAVACCRRVESLIPDEQSRAALNAAELFADKLISPSELERCERPVRTWDSQRRTHAAYQARQACACVAQQHAGHAVGAWRSAAFAKDWAKVEKLGLTSESPDFLTVYGTGQREEYAHQAALVRDIFGNPLRPVAFAAEWRTDTAVALARQMYESRDFGAMPILADALQDAGCDNTDVLNHCREEGAQHVRGCWVVDLVLGLS